MKNYLLANFILHHFNVLNFKLLILFDPAYYTPGAFFGWLRQQARTSDRAPGVKITFRIF